MTNKQSKAKSESMDNVDSNEEESHTSTIDYSMEGKLIMLISKLWGHIC